MGFQNKLQHLVDQVEGGIACILMGSDGLKVDGYHSPNMAGSDFDPMTFGIECTQLIGQMQSIAAQTSFSTLEEFSLQSDHQIALFRFLTKDYFLLLTLNPGGNTGKGRYLLRTLAPTLREELL